jgi:hypothetical protein
MIGRGTEDEDEGTRMEEIRRGGRRVWERRTEERKQESII